MRRSARPVGRQKVLHVGGPADAVPTRRAPTPEEEPAPEPGSRRASRSAICCRTFSVSSSQSLLRRMNTSKSWRRACSLPQSGDTWTHMSKPLSTLRVVVMKWGRSRCSSCQARSWTTSRVYFLVDSLISFPFAFVVGRAAECPPRQLGSMSWSHVATSPSARRPLAVSRQSRRTRPRADSRSRGCFERMPSTAHLR